MAKMTMRSMERSKADKAEDKRSKAKEGSKREEASDRKMMAMMAKKKKR